MYFHESPVIRVPRWQSLPLLAGLGDAVKKKPAIDRIQFIEGEVTRVEKGKRWEVGFKSKGPMSDDKKAKFIKRFIDPMLKHDLSINLLVQVNEGKHAVGIAWGNGKFGLNGTLAMNRREAVGGNGSAAVIVIDEQASDIKNLPTIIDNPDVLLFHELLHAFNIQRGTLVDDEDESEKRTIGIGKHTKAKPTENTYRDVKNLQRRCCRNRETL